MSKTYDVQDALKTSLEGVTEMAQATVLVDDQKDLEFEVKKAVGQGGGFACIIGAPRAENDERDLPKPRLRINLTLEFVFIPTISEHLATPAPAAHEVIEAVAKHCHKLTLSSRAHMCEQFEFLNWQLVSHPELLIYLMEIETIIQLS